ncbi:conserved hypothetical protein [Ricinus communis]|uniref:Uncharacterized protein n=1 Tax=Ricinus communis TaxID=3988 RepID=B9SFC2_RICCO|nr:conserved hypothetical protein [Ricinus communis]
MSYLSRVCKAAAARSMTAANPDHHGSKWKSTHQCSDASNKTHLFSCNDGGDGESKRKQAEESFQRVMYFNCWAQS